jgi:site-specific DNA-methyltransferase (adenine-specific)
MNTNVIFSSKTDEWETPQDFFNKLNSEFHFDLDVCATDKNAKCDCYFTKQDDGLRQPWFTDFECAWMNPPYGREIGKWVAKAYRESQNGMKVVCLLPARTDTKWFWDYIYHKAEIRFIPGRLKFSGAKYNAPFPCMVVVFSGVTPF